MQFKKKKPKNLSNLKLTCFKMPAAISWLQSKITWNSLPLFISFSKGFASFVSAGSWRILSRRLYLDGALMSSCKRMRPLIKRYRKRNWSGSCNHKIYSLRCLLFLTMYMRFVQKVSSHVIWKTETFIKEDTRYKKHCTQDNDASVPFSVDTLGFL